MQGATLEQIMNMVFEGHEVEFTFKGDEYSIELDSESGENVVRIWSCASEEPLCISTVTVKSVSDIDRCFDEKCFSGKSLKEIESEVIVETIF